MSAYIQGKVQTSVVASSQRKRRKPLNLNTRGGAKAGIRLANDSRGQLLTKESAKKLRSE